MRPRTGRLAGGESGFLPSVDPQSTDNEHPSYSRGDACMSVLARNPSTRGRRDPVSTSSFRPTARSDFTRVSSRPLYSHSLLSSAESPPQFDGHEVSVTRFRRSRREPAARGCHDLEDSAGHQENTPPVASRPPGRRPALGGTRLRRQSTTRPKAGARRGRSRSGTRTRPTLRPCRPWWSRASRSPGPGPAKRSSPNPKRRRPGRSTRYPEKRTRTSSRVGR